MLEREFFCNFGDLFASNREFFGKTDAELASNRWFFAPLSVNKEGICEGDA